MPSVGAPARALAATTPPLDGRLGGTQATFETRFGPSTGSDATFPAPHYRLGGFGVVAVAFTGDRAVTITLVADRLTHKPLNDPDPADWTPQKADQQAKCFLPRDVTLDPRRLDTGDGRQEVPCHSDALGAAYDPSTWQRLHAGGKPGDCYALYSPDAAGNVYEVVIGIGRAGALDRPTPTAIPTDVPSPTDVPAPTAPVDPRAQYTPLADVREIAIRPDQNLGQKITFSGRILTIRVAPAGRIFPLGDVAPKPYRALLQVQVGAPTGSVETVGVGYQGDTAGMFEGTAVTVYGVLVDTVSGINLLGGAITQPLVSAQFVDIQQ